MRVGISNERSLLSTSLNAVVFDMDGLMFNTEDLYNLAGDQLLKPRGLEFTRELKLAMMGLPGEKAFAIMIDRCELDDSVEQLQIETDQIFQSLVAGKDRDDARPANAA